RSLGRGGLVGRGWRLGFLWSVSGCLLLARRVRRGPALRRRVVVEQRWHFNRRGCGDHESGTFVLRHLAGRVQVRRLRNDDTGDDRNGGRDCDHVVALPATFTDLVKFLVRAVRTRPLLGYTGVFSICSSCRHGAPSYSRLGGTWAQSGSRPRR